MCDASNSDTLRQPGGVSFHQPLRVYAAAEKQGAGSANGMAKLHVTRLVLLFQCAL
jgi:hypothetical protein